MTISEAEKRAAGLGYGLDIGPQPVTGAELARRRAAQHAADERRRAVHRREDEAHEARQREKRAAHEGNIRRRGEVAAAEHRTAVERDLRRDGVAEADVKRLADAELQRYHLDRVTGATNLAEQTRREMAAAWRGAPPIDG